LNRDVFGAGGHSKVIAEILESMGKTILSLMTINALKKLGGQRSKRDTVSGENTFQF
jgi:hypothetical protein